MGQTTPNMSIYIPAAGETNYDASFAVGMMNVDQHNHTGGPDNGVLISTGAIADGSVTYQKLAANVVDTTTGLGTNGSSFPNQIVTTGLLKTLNNSGSSLGTGYLAINGLSSATVRTLTGTANQIAISNGTGASTPTFAFDTYSINPTQPRFIAYQSTNATNTTGDGTVYPIVCDATTYLSTPTPYNVSTGVFTAPVTGQYLFNAQVNLQNLSSSFSAGFLTLTIAGTSANVYQYNIGNVGAARDSGNNTAVQIQIMAMMTITDTAALTIQIKNGTKVVTVAGSSSPLETIFSGTLLV